ncbi:MAG TPA: hypothetical protein VJ813_15950 [Vicinamibacterales bacterium]|nr:hypothetical protein [Vicinamibacterales bacterium]
MAILAFCALTVSGSAPTQDFTVVGSFDNVRQSSSEDPHCYGWSLELWRYQGRVLGLLDRHQALCGDPPCQALTDVSHDPKTGRLTFSAFGMRFTGTLSRNEVTGRLGDERLNLKRKEDFVDARSNRSLDAWCDFWRGVSRCKGVAELCTALGAAKQ